MITLYEPLPAGKGRKGVVHCKDRRTALKICTWASRAYYMGDYWLCYESKEDVLDDLAKAQPIRKEGDPPRDLVG